MKKMYSKPEIMFESFAMSTNIAGDCEIKTNTPSKGTCAYKMQSSDEFLGEVNVFVTGIQACDYKEPEGYNGVCYHTFESSGLFNS